jgi:dTDP-4-dehydrorhamnose reductase
VEKVVIVGTDTMLGANLAHCWSDRCDVAALATTDLPDVFATAPQAERAAAWRQRVADERPTLIAYCGSLAKSAWELCPSDPQWCPTAAEIGQWCCGETAAIELAAKTAAECGSQLLLLTSDVGFTGPRIFHGEAAVPHAAGPLAAALSQIEGLATRAGALVVRTHAYGWSPEGNTVAERLWNALNDEQTAVVDAHRHATPILATDLADILYECCQQRLRGVYHVTGAERASYYRFAAELAVACGLTGRQVRLVAPPPESAARPHTEETSLNTQCIRRRLGRPMPMLREGLARFVQQGYEGLRNQLAGGPRQTPALSHAA